MSHVIVLGAGPAGLMAALRAARDGHECTVFEAAAVVGGMAGSFEVCGQRVDYGSHRLHPATPEPLLELIGDLLGPDLQHRHRAGRLRLRGRWVGFPLRFVDLVRTLPVGLTGRLALDSIRISTRWRQRPSVPLPGHTFHDEVSARLGPTVAAELYAPYARKLHGLDANALDPELARRRISAASPSDIGRRVLRATRASGRTFLYPRHGYGQIAQCLAEAAVDAGAVIELNAPVTGVGVDEAAVRVSTATRSVDGDVALSTLPLPVLASIVDPAPPPAVTAAVSDMRSRAMVLVYLVLDQARYTAFDAHYLPGLDTTISRLSEPKNYRDADDPPDRTVLCAEIPCWPGDGLWEQSDDRLAELVVEDLARAELPTARPVHVEIRRLRAVYPVLDLDGVAARAVVADWSTMSGRLSTLGRQGLGVADNLHHVLAMGSAAIDSLGSDGIDAVHWRRHLADFADHTVED